MVSLMDRMLDLPKKVGAKQMPHID